MWKGYVGFDAKLRHVIAEIQCAGASAEAERLLTIKSFDALIYTSRFLNVLF